MSNEKPEALTFDKSTWGDGAWQTEPDRIEFEHAGLPCLMLRAHHGGWCGYAAVPPGHSWHGKDYNDLPDYGPECHGGLTYSDRCSGHVCHVPKPGEPDDVWWFGFDCAHCFDVTPAREARLPSHLRGRDPRAQYRDADYVRREVERLAEQLAEAAR